VHQLTHFRFKTCFLPEFGFSEDKIKVFSEIECGSYSHTLFLFDFFRFLDIPSLIYIVYYTMAANTKKAEEKQKLVGVPSEESKDKYKEDSAIALQELQASQHRKKTIVKERRT
jgi:hypothetical protein